MGLKYYSKEINISDKFPPLSSDVDIYANTSVSYHKKHQCPSRSSPTETSMIKTHTGSDTYASIRNYNSITPSTQITHYLQNTIYANISILPSKLTDISNEAAYATLMNTTSITHLSNTDITINPKTLNEKNHNRTYENVKLCSIPSSSPTPLTFNESLSHRKTSTNNNNPSSSSHVYMNLEHHEDKSSVIPTSSPKNDQTEESQWSSIYLIDKEHVNIETNVLETYSNTNTIQTVEKFEINMTPHCGDKSDLYRTKIPTTIAQILPPFRQRRTLHRNRRHRRRNSIAIRTIINSNAMRRQQQQHSNSNVIVHHPIVTTDRWKRPLHKNQQLKSVSNQLYNEIEQPILADNQSLYTEEEIFACPIQFQGILQDQVFPWYPTENYNEEELNLVPKVFSITENGDTNQQNETANEEEEEQEQEEEEEGELFPHDTFEDFLLRRRPKSSCSTSASNTNTVISETISHEIPARPPPPLNRRSPGIALGLDKKDVDFIHDIIHRTQGDHRVSNRITALREAYIRARDKRNDLLKTPTRTNILQNDANKKKKTMPMKHSFIASKIRDELEKYDELPIHREAIYDDDDDDTYSTNDNYQFRRRTMPKIFSTAHRIINFVTTLKHQLQKNFQELRSRILIEAMSIQSNHVSRNRHRFHNSSGISHRHLSRPKTSHSIVRHTNSRQSIEHSHPFHRHQFYRTHSSTSQLLPQHFHNLPSFDKHSSIRPRTFRITPHSQRLHRMG